VIDDITAVFVLPGFRVVGYELVDGELTLFAETPRVLVGCPVCGAVANVKDRRTVTVRDLPVAGTPVIIKWRKRVFSCRHVLCENKTWTEQHEAIASRAVLTERARQWAFEQVGFHDRAVSVIADQLGVAWHTIMTQVIDRGTPLLDDPSRLREVSAIGVDETAFLRATGKHPTLYATGIADLTGGRTPRLLDVVQGRSGTVLGGWLGSRDEGLAGRHRDRVIGPVPRLCHRVEQPSPGRGPGARPLPPGQTRAAWGGSGPSPGAAGHPRAPRPEQ